MEIGGNISNPLFLVDFRLPIPMKLLFSWKIFLFYIPAFNFREHLMQNDGFGVFWKFLKSTLLDASRGERQVYKFDFATLWDIIKAFSSSKIDTYLMFDIWTMDHMTLLKLFW